MTSDLDNLFVGAIAFGMAVGAVLLEFSPLSATSIADALFTAFAVFAGILNLGVFFRRMFREQ